MRWRMCGRVPSLHKRWGTSFLLIVMLISIVFVYRVDNRILQLLLRLVLIPVIAEYRTSLSGLPDARIICLSICSASRGFCCSGLRQESRMIR